MKQLNLAIALLLISGTTCASTQFVLSQIKNNTDEPLILKINKGFETESLHIARGTTYKPNFQMLLKTSTENQKLMVNRDAIEIWSPNKRLFSLKAQRNQNGELITTNLNLSKFEQGREESKIASWGHKFLMPNVQNDVYKIGLSFDKKEGSIEPSSNRLDVKLIEE